MCGNAAWLATFILGLVLVQAELILHTNKQPGIHILPSETGVVPQGWTEYCLPASKGSGRSSAPLLDQAHPWRQSGLLSSLGSLPRLHLEHSRKGDLAHWKRTRNSSANWKTLVVTWVAVYRNWSISHATGAGSSSERCPPHGPGSSPNLPISPSKHIATGHHSNIYRANRLTWQHHNSKRKTIWIASNCSFFSSHIKQKHQGIRCLHAKLQ